MNTTPPQHIAFNSLLDKLSSALIGINQSGEIILWNTGAERFLEYSRKETMPPFRVETLFDAEFLELTTREIFGHDAAFGSHAVVGNPEQHSISPATPQQNRTYTLFQLAEQLLGKHRLWRMRTKSGTRFEADILSVMTNNEKSGEKAIFLIVNSAQNRETDDAKIQFLSRLSHEIRTPLHGIIGAIELLGQTALNDEQQDLMRLAGSKADVLLTLLNEIFEYSHSQGKTLILERAIIEPHLVIRNLTEVLQERIAPRELQVKTTIDAGVPHQVLCDPVRLTQVLLSATSVMAATVRQGAISLHAEYLSPSHTELSNLYFTIRANGHEYDASKREQILRVLREGVEIPDISTEIFQLALARTIINAMGGLIWGEAKENTNEIILYMMVSVEKAEALAAKPRIEPQIESRIDVELNTAALLRKETSTKTSVSIGTGASAKNVLTQTSTTVNLVSEQSSNPNSTIGVTTKKILVVDDDEDNCLLAEQYLKSLVLGDNSTPEIHIARDGEEAFKAAQNQRFDVILMDIQMPVLDGFGATERIRRYETEHSLKRTPILAITAHTMENYREYCLQHGMDDYISKPTKKLQIQDLVKKWLDKKIHVLIADDSEDYTLLLKLQFEKNAKFSVLFAQNGSEALELCRQHNIDAILLDMQMPIMTGYEAAPLIREIPAYRTIPIWGLTAHEDRQEIDRVLEAGCNRCFTKGSIAVIRQIIKDLDEHFTAQAVAAN